MDHILQTKLQKYFRKLKNILKCVTSSFRRGVNGYSLFWNLTVVIYYQSTQLNMAEEHRYHFNFEKESIVHINSKYKFGKRIFHFILGHPAAKHERNTQYKSVSISLNHQGHNVESHTFINNVKIYKINIIIQFTGPPTSGGETESRSKLRRYSNDKRSSVYLRGC